MPLFTDEEVWGTSTASPPPTAPTRAVPPLSALPVGDGTSGGRLRSMWDSRPRGNGHPQRVLVFLFWLAAGIGLALLLRCPIHWVMELLAWPIRAWGFLLDHGTRWRIPSSDAVSNAAWWGWMITIAAWAIVWHVLARAQQWIRAKRSPATPAGVSPKRRKLYVVLGFITRFVVLPVALLAILFGALLSARQVSVPVKDHAAVYAAVARAQTQLKSDEHQAAVWLASAKLSGAHQAAMNVLTNGIKSQATVINTAAKRLQTDSLAQANVDLKKVYSAEGRAGAYLLQLQKNLPKAEGEQP